MWPVGTPERAHRRGANRDFAMTAAGWAVGLLVTGFILFSPYLVFGYRNPYVHLVLDSVDACVALLVAYLVYGRFRRRRRLQDLLLAQGLVLLAVAGFGLTYATDAVTGFAVGTLDIWLPLTIRVIGALLITAAALIGDRLAQRPTARRTVIALLAAVAVLSLVLWAQRSLLPVALDQDYVPTSGQHAILTGHPLLLVGQAVAAMCFFVASIAFTSQSARRDDELLRWLGPACALAGFARVNYVLFPSLYTDWLYTGDLLRTGCYVLFLVGASREISQYWSAHARAAILEDRRRLARELHDGVAQELAFIRAQSHSIPTQIPSGPLIMAACDRALDEVRAAVQALGRPSDEPLGQILGRVARELADRYEVELEIDLDDTIFAEPDQQHALIRITREALSNAVRHGKANRVLLRLVRGDGNRHLVIRDDGAGFDVASVVSHSAGYGLISMRERARTLPGTFVVDAGPGTGSEVTVTW